MSHVIEARQLTKVYEGGVQVTALRGVDLLVEHGTFNVIMGPSGSGKSTLLNILGALEPPTTGQVRLEGIDLGALGEDGRTAFRRRRIGFIFQQFNLLPIFTAAENVALPLRLEGVPPRQAAERATEALELVGLASRRDHLPSHLSGGEQQRVAIARALISRPAILLADEPTGSLDSSNGERVIAMLRELVDKREQTLVLVTHDPSVASRADRVVCMRDGLVESDSDRRQGARSTADVPETRMISWRYTFSELRNRRGRSLLSLFSVVIAVATIVAVSSATATTRKAYQQVFQLLSGRADLEVVARGGGMFKQDIMDKLRAVPGVRDVLPVFHRSTNIYAGEKKATALAVGIIADDPESIYGFGVAEGRMPVEASEIAIDSGLAAALQVKVGGGLKLFLPRGLRAYTIVGTVTLANAVQMQQGGMLLAPLEPLQKACRAAGKVNALHLFLKDPDRAKEVMDDVAPLLPAELLVSAPSSRNALAEQTLQLTEVGLLIASALSFTVAVFIALSVFLMNVGERRRQLSILRAIGATRSQVMFMVCSEALVIGIVGTLLGIPVGMYGGQFVTGSIAAVLQVTLPQAPDVPRAFVFGCIVGPLICLLGSWYPARKASRISPLEGMRPIVTMEPHRGHGLMTLAGTVGMIVTVTSMSLAIRGDAPIGAAVFAVILSLISMVFLMPVLLSPSVNLLGLPLRRLLSVEGEMSQRLVLRHSGRSSLTIGVLFIAVASGMALSNTVFSIAQNVRTWHQRTMTADFFVRTMMPDLSGKDPTSMPDSLRDEIAAFPEVQTVEAISVLRVEAAGDQAILAARDFSLYGQSLPLDLTEGDESTLVKQLRDGEVVVGSVLAERAHLHPGDTVTATAGTEQHPLRVAGVTNEYLSGGSVLYMDREAALRTFKFEGIDSFLIKAKPGDRSKLFTELQPLTAEHGVMLQSFADLEKTLDDMVKGATGGLWVVLGLMLLVGALGVVNTLTMNILEQTRELGMLRAIGMGRLQIVKTVMGQAAFIGLLGVIAGAITGLVLARTINYCLGALFGHPVAFALRPEFAVVLLTMAVAVVFLAALEPARRAANLNPIEAMRQE